jgi:hypothetical protein
VLDIGTRHKSSVLTIKIAMTKFARKVLLNPYYLNYANNIILVGGTPIVDWRLEDSHITHFLLLFRCCLQGLIWLTMQSWFHFDIVIGGWCILWDVLQFKALVLCYDWHIFTVSMFNHVTITMIYYLATHTQETC